MRLSKILKLDVTCASLHRSLEKISIERGTRHKAVGFEDERVSMQFEPSFQLRRSRFQDSQRHLARILDRSIGLVGTGQLSRSRRG